MTEEAMASSPEINVETVEFLIEKAREFETPELVIEDEEAVPGGDPKPDMDMLNRVTDLSDMTNVPLDDPSFVEAKAHIEALNVDEQCQLVALAWVGRGAYDPDEWDDAVRDAQAAHNRRTAEYLFGMPHLAANLEAGLDAFDISARVES
jgi:hypothetical protein